MLRFSQGNLIYLARMTNRVPVLPPLDSYIGRRPQPIPFSTIFDVPRMERELGMDIIEWKDVKNTVTEDHQDKIGCWTLWATAEGRPDGEPRGSRHQYSLHLGMRLGSLRRRIWF